VNNANKTFLRIASYTLFIASGLALLYFRQYFLASGFLLSILCTTYTQKRTNTLVTTLSSIITLSAFAIIFKEKSLSDPLYLYFLLLLLLTGAIVFLNKKFNQHIGKDFQKLEALFNYATIGIVVTNKRGLITNFNKYAENQFGYSKAEVVGKPVELLIPAKFRGEHPKHRTDFHHHPAPRIMGDGRDLKARKKDGTEFATEISLSHYSINNETFVIAFVVDITVRKRNEEVVIRQHKELEQTSLKIKEMVRDLEDKVKSRTVMLKEALEKLEHSKQGLSEALENEIKLSDLKSRFVTIASHEFRTPLSTILSSAELLHRYNDPGEEFTKRERHIQRITSSVAGMKKILEDFLSLQKMDEGFLKPNMQLIMASECIREIQDTIHGMQVLTKKGQQVEFVYELVNPVLMDLSLLRYILINLISNAIKFSAENSIIKVNIQLVSEDICLVVQDDGIGVSAEDQKHLFERFFRAANAAAIPGTGLGLHIVFKYTELMKGSVRIESRENQGTTFSICIPQKRLPSFSTS